MIPWLFLGASVVGSCFTLTALLRGRHLSALVVPYFFAAWLTSELALNHVVWQAAATVAFVAAGALQAWPGWLGLGLTAKRSERRGVRCRLRDLVSIDASAGRSGDKHCAHETRLKLGQDGSGRFARSFC